MHTMENKQSAGEPAVTTTVADGSGCCGDHSGTGPTANVPQAEPCCGTPEQAAASQSCCGTAARTDAVASGAGCCG